MKAKFRNYIVDSKREPIQLVFDSKEEKIEFAEKILQSVVSRVETTDIEEHSFVEFPKGTNHIEEFKSSVSGELKDPDDKFVRISAEFENYKKRMQRDKEELENRIKLSAFNVALEIDNDLELSLSQLSNDEDRRGIELILSKIQIYLKNNGIESVQTETYDPNIHEVISVIENGNKDQILNVVSEGYKVGNKIIKYPKVIIGK